MRGADFLRLEEAHHVLHVERRHVECALDGQGTNVGFHLRLAVKVLDSAQFPRSHLSDVRKRGSDEKGDTLRYGHRFALGNLNGRGRLLPD